MPSYEKTITLPSKGQFYGDAIPGGELQLRSMTTQEEKILSAPSQSGNRNLDNLFKRCSSLPESFPPNNLLTSDRLSLLLHLRVISYGPSYVVSWTCGDCRARNTVEIDLEKEILSEENVLDDCSEEQVELTLPKSGKVLTLRRPVGKDEEDAVKFRKRVKGTIADIDQYRRAACIVTIDGVPLEGVREGLSFISKMQTLDSIAMRDAISEMSFGVEKLTLDFVCNECGAQSEPLPLPINEDFFRVVSPQR